MTGLIYPKNILPIARPTRFEFGRLTGTKIPIRVCQGDQTAAVFGYGNLPLGTAHVNLGTGGFVLSPLMDLERVRQQENLPLLISLGHSDENNADYFLEGTVNGSGSAIKWAAEHLGLGSVETSLDRWAEEVEQPPLFYNSVGGIGSPIWNANAPLDLANRWFDQDLNLIPREDVQANEAMVGVLESIVFLVAMNIGAMRKLGVEPAVLRLSGGVTTNRWLCQKLADLTRCQIIRPDQIESTVLGVARLLGKPSDQSTSAPESASVKATNFAPRQNHLIQERYDLFQSLISKKPK